LQQRRVIESPALLFCIGGMAETMKGRRLFMSENQEYKKTAEEADEAPQSPAEKLEENKPLGSLTPGAENQESVEIKDEIKPNTE
jgi:hypothetical protein